MCIVFDGEMMRQVIFASRNPHRHRAHAPTISRTKRVRNMAQMHAPARHVVKPHKGWFRPALWFHTVENILACDGRHLSCQPPMNLSSVGSGTQKTPAALRRDNVTFVLSSISMDVKTFSCLHGYPGSTQGQDPFSEPNPARDTESKLCADVVGIAAPYVWASITKSIP